MPTDGEPDFKSAYERHSRHAHIAAYILVAGLVLELINGFIWYHGIETLASMVAVLLIVGGVWGEIFFENRARKAGDKQLAQYESRTAEANRASQQARLELERMKAPRVLDEAAFLRELNGKTTWPIVEFWYVDAADCLQLAGQITVTLHNAGWPLAAAPRPLWQMNPGSEIPDCLQPMTMSYGAHMTGVSVVAKTIEDDSPQKTLMRAFAIGLPGRQASGGRDGSMSEGTLRIVVAPRP
ncbi:MAG: hypothetical protein ISP45_21570 [Reyranella sp.]|nr:hypothetical protein [Reyranella sp.]